MQHVYIHRKNGLINVIQINFAVLNVTEPNPVAELTNAGVYGRTLAGTVGANASVSMDICLVGASSGVR